MSYPRPILHLVMPGPPPKGLNGSQGYARRKRSDMTAQRDEWSARVLAAASEAGRPKVTEPVAMVWARLYGGRGAKPMDQRNLQASAKIPEDWLVRHGILDDDGPDHVVQSVSVQRKVAGTEQALAVLAFPARFGAGSALRDVAWWVTEVWESEHAWRSVLGESSQPFASGWFFPRWGASVDEWLHGTTWDDHTALGRHRNPHLQVVHKVVDRDRGWEKPGKVDLHLRSIKAGLARLGVLVSTTSYREELVALPEQRGVRLLLHAPTPLAKATA